MSRTRRATGHLAKDRFELLVAEFRDEERGVEYRR
jgi:hypothetical protein